MTSRPGTLRRIVTLVLLVPLFWLTPLCYASPPDQTWIGGFYDDADYDDIVLLALSIAMVLADTAPSLDLRPIVVAILLLPDVEVSPFVVRLGPPGRAPPLA